MGALCKEGGKRGVNLTQTHFFHTFCGPHFLPYLVVDGGAAHQHGGDEARHRGIDVQLQRVHTRTAAVGAGGLHMRVGGSQREGDGRGAGSGGVVGGKGQTPGAGGQLRVAGACLVKNGEGQEGRGRWVKDKVMHPEVCIKNTVHRVAQSCTHTFVSHVLPTGSPPITLATPSRVPPFPLSPPPPPPHLQPGRA